MLVNAVTILSGASLVIFAPNELYEGYGAVMMLVGFLTSLRR